MYPNYLFSCDYVSTKFIVWRTWGCFLEIKFDFLYSSWKYLLFCFRINIFTSNISSLLLPLAAEGVRDHEPWYIVKSLYSGNHRDLKIVSVYWGARYIEVLPKLAYFASKTCSGVLGYNPIDPEVCHCKEQVVGHVQQKSPWSYSSLYPCSISLWASLQLRNTSTMEMNTVWKSTRVFIFMDLKRPLNWLKNKTTKIKKNLHETVKTCLK